jgi:thioredoxin reductase (NADPH)
MFDWDAIVVGGGPAGLTAGLYLARGKVRTLLIEEDIFGGKIKNVEWIENYPGYAEGISGAQLATSMQEQAAKYGLQYEMGKVTSIELFSSTRYVTCSTGKGYTTSVIILTGGSHHRKLGVPGEDEFHGKGVFNCSLCDGSQYADRAVVVCGGGDAGITEALYMTKIASKVVLMEMMPILTASAIMQDRARANPKLEIHTGVRIEKIVGGSQVEGIEYSVDGKKSTMAVDGVLVNIGFLPNTSYLSELVPLDAQGQIKVSNRMETEVPFIFAAGDIRSCSPGQVSSAVGDGATAAISAIRLLQKEGQV